MLASHGIHDSVLISGRKSVIICVMLGLDYILFYRVEEIMAHLLKPKMSY